MSYWPFDKPLRELDEESLDELIEKQVCEGHFIEAKSIFQSNPRMAAALSSFANSNGGVCFIGAETNEENIIIKFPGILPNTKKNIPDYIRDIIVGNINPIFYWDTKIINLKNKRQVIVIKINESIECPHIHSNGRIYIRHGEGKEPYGHIKDHSALNAIYNRGEKFKDIIKTFCDKGLDIQYEFPCLEVYVWKRPWSQFRSWVKPPIELEEFFTIVNNPFELTIGDKPVISASLPFENIHLGASEYVAKQSIRDVSNPTLTFRFWANGCAKCFIPISDISYMSGSPWRKDELFNDFLETIKKFIKSELPSILDGNIVFFILSQFFSKYFQFQVRINMSVKELCIGLRLKNVGHKTMFMRFMPFIQQVEKYGIPILNNSYTLPIGDYVREPIVYLPKEEDGDNCMKGLISAALASRSLFSAIGYLHDWMDDKTPSIMMKSYENLKVMKELGILQLIG